jgi:glycosyltransferase involved in cell wall biosynthesis
MIPNAAGFSLSEKLLHEFDRDSFRKQQGWEGKFVALYVGAHGVANHLIQVLEAAELVRDTNVHLVLIGAGMQREMLLEEVAKRGLTNVQMLPPVSKEAVFEYILACDAGMSVLKKVDTFKTVYSNKTFDYMACQRPILMAIDGVSRQLVEDAKCGLYVEPENPEELAKAILYLKQNPEITRVMGMAGYQYAKHNFDREVLANQYLQEMKNLVNTEK